MKTKMKKYLLALLLLLSTIFLNVGLETPVSQTFSTFPITAYGTVSYSKEKMFGVNVNWGYSPDKYDFLMDRVAELGVGWLRIDVCWDWMEPQPRVYVFDELDELVNLARAHGIEPLPVVVHAPSWATGSDNKGAPPTDVNYFKDFVKTVVGRYNPKAIEISNEPRHFFSGTPEQFVDLIRAGFEGAKEVKPDCIIIGGWGGGPIWGGYDPYGDWGIGTLADLGLLDYYDALAIHPYTDSTPPEDVIPDQLQKLRNFLASVGKADMPLWVTEFGYGLGSNPPAGKHTLESQADFTIRAAQLLFDDPHVKNIIYFALQGSPPTTDFNLVENGWNPDSSLTPRPVFYEYQNFISTHG